MRVRVLDERRVLLFPRLRFRQIDLEVAPGNRRKGLRGVIL